MICAIFLLFLFSTALSHPAFSSFKPDEIKAAYLYNLTNFVHWPDAQPEKQTFIIKVFGNRAVARNLGLLTRGEKLRGANIVIQYIDSVLDIYPCQMLFVDGSVQEQLTSKMLSELASKQILIIGDTLDFLQKGAMVGLLENGGRILIAVDPDLARKAGISFSSKLLKVARILE